MIIGFFIFGGIVGQFSSSNKAIKKCNNSGILDTKDANQVGGIAGNVFVENTIEDCINSGSIKGKNFIGGIVGYVNRPIILKESQNMGTIDGDLYIGGIAGYVIGELNKCINRGNINGGSSSDNASTRVGGVVGLSGPGNISLCINNGSVTGPKNRVGGVIGDISSGKVYKCVNNGEVKSQGCYIGGVIGHITTDATTSSNTVSFCYNTGKVFQNSSISAAPGGIVGRITR